MTKISKGGNLAIHFLNICQMVILIHVNVFNRAELEHSEV